MYNSLVVANRIKSLSKVKRIIIKDMLFECGLSKNTLSSMLSGGSMPKSENLAKIADYLNCSVDYLLGRTNNPEINKNEPIAAEAQQSPFDYAEIAAEGGTITRGPLRKKPETTF